MGLGMRLHKRKRSGRHFEGVKIEQMVKTVFTNRLDWKYGKKDCSCKKT